MRETNSKNQATWPKNHIVRAVRRYNEADMYRLPKDISRASYLASRVHIPNFNFLAQCGAEIGEQQLFFKVKKKRKPLISPFLTDLGS